MIGWHVLANIKLV